ncbi:hypothetical protein RISK_001928 [Rhodopirellula islandica]|uniref:Uncharacterized protein n=1 Tax=Rhodopirellula islandica TaxID=595434 RepID=A0A0J1BHS2_RHOIS|nr:hypothetical protein RISK_001928 [Rhodopirellula islandica]
MQANPHSNATTTGCNGEVMEGVQKIEMEATSSLRRLQG